MGSSNPIQQITNAATNVVSTVANTVTAPAQSVVKLAQGDVEGAGNTIVGGALKRTPAMMVIDAGGNDVKKLFNSKEANNLTLGFTGDAIKANDAANTMRGGRSISGEQAEDLARYGVKAAVLTTGVSYAASSGYAATAGEWAMANPTTAATSLALVSQGKGGSAVTNVANNILPGSGNLIDPILNPPAVRAPASVSTGGASPVGNAYDSYSVGALDSTTKFALLGAAVTVLLLIFKKLKR